MRTNAYQKRGVDSRRLDALINGGFVPAERTTITMPASLREQAVKYGINISAVARKALSQAILEHELAQGLVVDTDSEWS